MKYKIPKSPFSTRLSGSAKETELRIRSIFQWKKKRPPVVFFVISAAVVLLCGTLVSCQVQQGQEEPPVSSPTATPESTPDAKPTETPVIANTWSGETLTFPGGEFTIDLPKEWAGKIGYIMAEDAITFVHLATRETKGFEHDGVLYWIERRKGHYSMDSLDPQPGWAVAATLDHNYTIWLGCASDVQHPGDQANAEEYKLLFQPEQLRFNFTDWFVEKCAYAGNIKCGATQSKFAIYRCDDVYKYADTLTCGSGTVFLPDERSEYVISDCQFLLCDDGCKPASVVSRASQGYACAYEIVQTGEFVGKYRTMRFAMKVPEPMIDSLKQQGVYDQVLAQLARGYFYLLELDDTHYVYIHVEPREEDTERPEDETERVDAFVRTLRFEFSKD